MCFPAEFQSETAKLRDWISSSGNLLCSSFLVERLLLDVDGAHAQKLAKVPALMNFKHGSLKLGQRLATVGQRVPALETRCRYNWIRSQLAAWWNDPMKRCGQSRIALIISPRIVFWVC